MGYIDEGQEGSGKLLAGGSRVGDNGYFVKPTIFCGREGRHEHRAGRDLRAGHEHPDVSRTSRKSWRARTDRLRPGGGRLDEGHRKAHAIADSVRAGTVWVNCYDVFDAGAPFGGFKMSGIGRELGEYGSANYTEVKTVTVKL